MALSISAETKDGVARLVLEGELDATVANDFRQAIEAAAAENPTRLVLFLEQLTFMASAGLRMLIFAKQKMGSDVGIYIVKAQPPVVRTLEMSGFHRSVYLRDEYDD